MNFFSQAGDIAKGMMNYMNNNRWNSGSDKENALRKKLENCTYPDETKFVIEKAVKQVYHVYSFFDADIIMFNENGFQRRYLEVKGIIELDVKSKNCKVDFNMMLPADYPRSSPFVRIVNRNPDYRVDPYYQPLQSKTDKSSYILSDKLNSCKNWHPSSSLVNVIIESYDMLKTRFPFSKPTQDIPGKSSPWDALYNKNQPAGFNNNNNNMGGMGGGFSGGNNNNNWGGGNWVQTGNNNTWGANNNSWGNNNNNNSWGNNNNNNWGNPGGWGNNNKPIGGMGSLIGANNSAASIAAGQKLVGKQKQTLQQINGDYLKVLEKNQHLDATRQSLEVQEATLRNENYQMTNFLKASEQQGAMPALTSFVKPANEFSEQLLELLSSFKAREDCITLLQNKFNQEELSLQDFMKQLRKMEEARFEERVLLQKCLRHSD